MSTAVSVQQIMPLHCICKVPSLKKWSCHEPQMKGLEKILVWKLGKPPLIGNNIGLSGPKFWVGVRQLHRSRQVSPSFVPLGMMCHSSQLSPECHWHRAQADGAFQPLESYCTEKRPSNREQLICRTDSVTSRRLLKLVYCTWCSDPFGGFLES